MKTTVYIATSLDGFIARKDGNIDWMLNIENPGNEDYGYGEFISKIDALVMGEVPMKKFLHFRTGLINKKSFY